MRPPPFPGSTIGDSDLLAGLGARDEDPQRVTCEHADRCGGCPVIALSYGEQLGLKRGRVVQSVARYPALELVYTEPVQAAEPITQYRTRAKLIVAPGGKSSGRRISRPSPVTETGMGSLTSPTNCASGVV